MEGGGVKHVLHADDPVLVEETREHLQHIVNQSERECNEAEN